jgi:hypothetical protein
MARESRRATRPEYRSLSSSCSRACGPFVRAFKLASDSTRQRYTRRRVTALQTLDLILGVTEGILVTVSLVWLLVAVLRPTPRDFRCAFRLSVLLAVTVAQPLGVVASRQSQLPPADAKPVSTEGIHVARLFGVVPLLPFALYDRENPIELEHKASTLRARSWLWLPVLTNSTDITRMCDSEDVVTYPCWESSADRTTFYNANNLRVVTKDGEIWATLYKAHKTLRSPPTYTPFATWKLEPGIASPAGVIYWGLVALMLPLAWLRLKRRVTGQHHQSRARERQR